MVWAWRKHLRNIQSRDWEVVAGEVDLRAMTVVALAVVEVLLKMASAGAWEAEQEALRLEVVEVREADWIGAEVEQKSEEVHAMEA